VIGSGALTHRMDSDPLNTFEIRSMDNICIGTAQFGMSYGVANKTGQLSSENIRKIIDFVVEKGITYFDTAQSYGNSESILGELFRDLNLTEKVNVISKLKPEFEYVSYEDLENSVRSSLDNLNVNSLFGLLTHRTTTKGDWDDFINAILTLKQNRLISKFGISIYDPEDALQAAENEAESNLYNLHRSKP